MLGGLPELQKNAMDSLYLYANIHLMMKFNYSKGKTGHLLIILILFDPLGPINLLLT